MLHGIGWSNLIWSSALMQPLSSLNEIMQLTVINAVKLFSLPKPLCCNNLPKLLENCASWKGLFIRSQSSTKPLHRPCHSFASNDVEDLYLLNLNIKQISSSAWNYAFLTYWTLVRQPLIAHSEKSTSGRLQKHTSFITQIFWIYIDHLWYMCLNTSFHSEVFYIPTIIKQDFFNGAKLH